MIYQLYSFSPADNGIQVSVGVTLNDFLELSYSIKDPEKKIVWPKVSDKPCFQEGLYHTTCFEFFVQSGGHYLEWNFSPSLNWAVFVFDGYRSRIPIDKSKVVEPIDFELVNNDPTTVTLKVKLALPESFEQMTSEKLSSELRSSATCVLDYGDRCDYWATAHCGEKPDFHLSDSFTLKL